MRERLAEIYHKIEIEFLDYMIDIAQRAINDDIEDEIQERQQFYVDKLLEYGVIVPPCKVGDTLYYIPFGSTVTKWEIRSIEIMQDDIVFHCGKTFFLKYDIGKTVFLTKEEAEAALKGGAE